MGTVITNTVHRGNTMHGIGVDIQRMPTTTDGGIIVSLPPGRLGQHAPPPERVEFLAQLVAVLSGGHPDELDLHPPIVGVCEFADTVLSALRNTQGDHDDGE